MKINKLAVLALCVFAVQAFATFQEADNIIHNGESYRLLTSPMEQYFEKFPERRPPPGGCSNNWSGYHAKFEIIQNELWVVDIQSRAGCGGGPSITRDCLDGQESAKVDWFTGLLVIPTGDMIGYPVGFGEYAEYKLIEIENGNYVKEFDLTHEQFLDYLRLAAQAPSVEWFTGAAAGTKNFSISTADELAGLAMIVNGTAKDGEGKYVRHEFDGDTVMLTNNINLSVYSVGEGWVPIGSGAILPLLTPGEITSRIDLSFRGTFDGGGKVISNLTINRPFSGRWQGLFGLIEGGSVKNLGLENVNITAGGIYVGAIVGLLRDGGLVAGCYSTGTVAGKDNVGGVAGGVLNVSGVTDSYSAAAVSGDRSVGGIVGLLGGVGIYTGPGEVFVPDVSQVTNSYSTGTVSGAREVGGIVGTIETGSRVANCAALNPSVTATIQNEGRVAGHFDRNRRYLYDNFSYTEMTNNIGNTTWANKGAGEKDGADLTAAEVMADGTINGSFVNAGVWTAENGKLPGLFGKTVAMPAHLSGGVSVKFATRNQTAPPQFVKATGRTLHLRLTGRGRVDIYALNGARVRTFDLNQGTHTLRLNSLPRGMYVVKAQSGAWKQSARVLVK